MPNPLLEPFATPFGAPPCADIRPEHFRPAFDAAMVEQKAAIDAITAEPAAASFGNTIIALEKSGLGLDQIGAVFGALTGADTNDALEAIEREVAPLLARHGTAILLNEALFRRI